MVDSGDLVANITLPASIAAEIESETAADVALERVEGEESGHHFGIAEAVVLVGLAKGVIELVKLAVEVRDRLRAAGSPQAARISSPVTGSWAEIRASMGDQEVETAVRRQFG